MYHPLLQPFSSTLSTATGHTLSRHTLNGHRLLIATANSTRSNATRKAPLAKSKTFLVYIYIVNCNSTHRNQQTWSSTAHTQYLTHISHCFLSMHDSFMSHNSASNGMHINRHHGTSNDSKYHHNSINTSYSTNSVSCIPSLGNTTPSTPSTPSKPLTAETLCSNPEKSHI